MKTFRVLAGLAIAGLSFAAGAWSYKFLLEDSCYDAGGMVTDSGFCNGFRE